MAFKVASRVRGMSDEAFREAFGREEQCRATLVRLRWPDGFVCPSCGHRGHCVMAGRGLYQCNRCKRQTSPTAGTIFHATKLPLTLWFAAIHLIVTAKNGVSSVELGRRLGVKQPTAWSMKHKIMAVMARREVETRLSGRVEMDDAYLGGRRSGGKRGRGAARQDALRRRSLDRPQGAPAQAEAGPGQRLPQARDRGSAHRARIGGRDRRPRLLESRVLTVIGRSAAQAPRRPAFVQSQHDARQHQERTGTYRKLGPDHAERFARAWRYNRRYHLKTMIPRFVHSAARTNPLPYRSLVAGWADKQVAVCIYRTLNHSEVVLDRGADGPVSDPPGPRQHRRRRPGRPETRLRPGADRRPA